MSVVAIVLTGLGVLLLVVSAIGLFRLPDALARHHAATKSGTLALGLVLVGVALAAGEPGWWLRVGLILSFLIATLPVAAQMLARAAARETHDDATLRGAPRVEADEPSSPSSVTRPPVDRFRGPRGTLTRRSRGHTHPESLVADVGGCCSRRTV